MLTRQQALAELIVLLDEKIKQQVSIIMQDKSFIRLEASWRGLHFLVNQSQVNIHAAKFRFLCMTAKEFQRDMYSNTDFEQTLLYRLVYNREYGQAGGVPFGNLMLDIDLTIFSPTELPAVFANLMSIASSAFLPIFMQVPASWLGLTHFNELKQIQSYLFKNSIFQAPRLQRLRKQDDARYLYFTAQKCLWRKPYYYQYQTNNDINFIENISENDALCWGSSVYLLAKFILQSYYSTGWFIDIESENIPIKNHFQISDIARTTPLPHLDAHFFNKHAMALNNQGIVVFSEDMLKQEVSIQYASSWLTMNLHSGKVGNFSIELANSLKYLLCVCRFAHYLKILARNKIGVTQNADQLQLYLQQWIFKYCGQADSYDKDDCFKYPLHTANITVDDHSSLPGHYICQMQLEPNFRFEHKQTSLKLISMLSHMREGVV